MPHLLAWATVHSGEFMSYDTVHYASLQRRSVVITGGASGIGEQMARAFAAQGSRVHILDIARDAGAALANALPGSRFHACDLRDIAALRRVLGEIDDIDVLVNNAARDDRHDMMSVEPEQWREYLSVNLDHQFFATQAVASRMAERGRGSVILFGSISWMRARPGMVAYTTAKAAINGLTRTLARELGPKGIRVNCIVPGAILTDRQARLWRSPDVDARILELQALKLMLDGSYVARMALFLGSDEAAGCTGQNFVVDAGLTLN
jgi:NAD(P)-dependent dehydrogenase (short-subunit alcohol dehydrogenase family)